MFRFSLPILRLRPREVGFTPPKLIRRPAEFTCKYCKHKWSSSNVWVTKMTRQCYQGETCVKCGTTNKPFHVGSFERNVFNKQGVDKKPHLGKHLYGYKWK